MTEPHALLARLDEIGRSLAQHEHACALIGLGSVGAELERLDAWSDLDFFVIVEAGHKQQFLTDLGWLSAPCPLVYYFANTTDGYKALYSDGIFCEFAVFEPDELEAIPFAAGRWVWRRPNVPETLGQPGVVGRPAHREAAWLLGEALTNLYVGLGRERRGERLSAQRFIQHYAVDRVVELIELNQPPPATIRDPFAAERRFEQRYPHYADRLATWVGGYAHNQAAALALLAFLEQHFEVNPALAAEIRALCV